MPEIEEKKKPFWLQSKITGDVFVYTAILATRADMQPLYDKEAPGTLKSIPNSGAKVKKTRNRTPWVKDEEDEGKGKK